MPSNNPSSPTDSPSTSACTCSATTSRFSPGRGRARPASDGVDAADVDAVLGVDAEAFDAFWRFDHDGLADARAATPTHRFQVAVVDRTIVGYHVTGRAGILGYLQRLAVQPAYHGRGIGTALVGDALAWCRRHRCTSVMVNTQEANRRALRLYEHLGFIPEPHGLAVLEHPLVPSRSGPGG